MREIFTYGSVGRAPGNQCLYPEAYLVRRRLICVVEPVGEVFPKFTIFTAGQKARLENRSGLSCFAGVVIIWPSRLISTYPNNLKQLIRQKECPSPVAPTRR